MTAQFAVFDSRNPASPCYHCLFPEAGEATDGPCATFGVLAPLVGVIGSLQAVEAVKLLAGIAPPVGMLTLYDALAGQFQANQRAARSGVSGMRRVGVNGSQVPLNPVSISFGLRRIHLADIAFDDLALLVDQIGGRRQLNIRQTPGQFYLACPG